MANDLANKIKNYRIDNNLTLDELAHKSGSKESPVQRVVRALRAGAVMRRRARGGAD
jgi:transcriptional regulator with XRE-family HTH domain